ncbi:MAG: c-type cytochrome domain-containing protein, partial [Microcystis sp.]
MKRVSSFLIYLSIGCLSLLLFLLLFESQVQVPAWLQVVGRMHPLFLHFPVALLVFSSISLFFSPSLLEGHASLKILVEWGMLLSAATSCVTALMGFLLSRESGYDTESLFWHKWSGLIVSADSLMIYFFRHALVGNRMLQIGSSVSLLLLIIFTGHQGSGITHGQNFLLAPILPEKPPRSVSWEDALVYADLVQPILEEKCITCHNQKKAKGELVMETTAALLKGGKNGKLWDLGEKDFGLLLRRIHLPLEEKKHMPPQGKPQLSEEEQAILYYWIKGGSSFTQKLNSLPLEDTLRGLAERILSTSTESVTYDFEPAAESLIRQLTTDHRVIYTLSLNSPALGINFYNKDEFSAKDLEELAPIKEQIVELDLSRMPVEDQHLPLIASFIHLQKLHLNFTRVTGGTIAALQNLKQLHQLSLAGTPLNSGSLSSLKKFPVLRKVMLWNTPLSEQQLTTIRQENKSIAFETGLRTDTVLLPLTPPILLNEEQVLSQPVPLKMKHYISGVNIRYTTDGSEPDSLT